MTHTELDQLDFLDNTHLHDKLVLDKVTRSPKFKYLRMERESSAGSLSILVGKRVKFQAMGQGDVFQIQTIRNNEYLGYIGALL